MQDQEWSRWRVWDKTGKHIAVEVDAQDKLHAKIKGCLIWKERWTDYGKNCEAEQMTLTGELSGERRVLSVRNVKRCDKTRAECDIKSRSESAPTEKEGTHGKAKVDADH